MYMLMRDRFVSIPMATSFEIVSFVDSKCAKIETAMTGILCLVYEIKFRQYISNLRTGFKLMLSYSCIHLFYYLCRCHSLLIFLLHSLLYIIWLSS